MRRAKSLATWPLIFTPSTTSRGSVETGTSGLGLWFGGLPPASSGCSGRGMRPETARPSINHALRYFPAKCEGSYQCWPPSSEQSKTEVSLVQYRMPGCKAKPLLTGSWPKPARPTRSDINTSQTGALASLLGSNVNNFMRNTSIRDGNDLDSTDSPGAVIRDHPFPLLVRQQIGRRDSFQIVVSRLGAGDIQRLDLHMRAATIGCNEPQSRIGRSYGLPLE